MPNSTNGNQIRPSTQPDQLEIWGGIECTVNRVGDLYLDQVKRSGHHHRVEDIDCIASLGTKSLRYPVLWERTAPDHPERLDWRWSDERLNRLRDLAINPIVGLIHHGCGPCYATFDSTAFCPEFARYARLVAERYPWVIDYTPINEPLTTARFAGLYGHWYPHSQSDKQFVRLLIRQLQATVLAMEQIRSVQPAARLIQTEDLGYVHSTPGVQYQADFENERRFLAWDLLAGYVTPDHALWEYLLVSGATESELWSFAEQPCPPSIIGANYYITSERFLDEYTAQYPSWLLGTNGVHDYADTEVVRTSPEHRLGLGNLLMQVWKRYGLPIAVTEAHLGDCVDEQKRWLGEVWQQAQAAKRAGVDVQAVTAWALFGLYDWHCLLTRQENRYEPGAFTVCSGKAVPTDLAEMIVQLANGKPVEELIPSGIGWWQVLRESQLLTHDEIDLKDLAI